MIPGQGDREDEREIYGRSVTWMEDGLQEVGYYCSVGESLKLSHDKQLALVH